MKSIQVVAHALMDLVYPRDCVCCGAPVDNPPSRYLCAHCAATLDPIASPFCEQCGIPLYGAVSGIVSCSKCKEKPPYYQRGRAAYLFRDHIQHIVHELKYHNGTHLLADIRHLLLRAPSILEFAQNSLLVPVPLHPRKKRERGFNQSELLTEVLAGLVPSSSVFPCLQRTRDTSSQTLLDCQARFDNVKNAFALLKSYEVDPTQRYLVVDDVFTTGATLNACTRALLHGGARMVDVLTFAHG